MSLYKREGQALWSYDFWISNRRFSGSTGTASKREAERFVVAKRKEARRLVDQAVILHSNSPITVEMAASRYWDEAAQFFANKQDYYRYLGILVERLGKATLLHAINDSIVAKLIAMRRNEGVTNATVNRSVTEPLRAIALRARDIWKVPSPDVVWKKHRLKEPQERVREASLDEEAKLMAAIRPDYAPVLLFALLSACRFSEIVELQWRHVDFFNREFTVHGKGDKKRSIPMTTAIRELLWSLKNNHQTAVFTYVATKTRGPHRKGERYPITKSGLKSEWKLTLRRSGVKDYRFHDNRHTAATRLIRATGNLKMVQQLLGHGDVSVSSRYAHVTKDDLRDGMEASQSPSRAKTPTENPTIGEKTA